MKTFAHAGKCLSMPKAEQALGKAIVAGNIMFFLISLAIHGVALAALWFLAVPASGMGQTGMSGYMTVSLLSGPPGDFDGGSLSAARPDTFDAAPTSAPETGESAIAPSAAPTAPDTASNAIPDIAHTADPDPKQPATPPAESPVPVRSADAIPVRKEKAEQKELKKPKAGQASTKKAVDEHARLARAASESKSGKAPVMGREQPGPTAGPGVGREGAAGQEGAAQAGEKGGVGRESSAAAHGTSAGYIKGNYEYIKKRVKQYLVYSPQAKRMGIQGMVAVAFTIQQDGGVRDVAVSKSSGYALLDESALEAVRRAAPFAPPPEPARVIMPVQFSLR